MGTGFPPKLQLKALTPIRKLFHRLDKLGNINRNKGVRSPLRASNKRGKSPRKSQSKAGQPHEDGEESNTNTASGSTNHDQSFEVGVGEGLSTHNHSNDVSSPAPTTLDIVPGDHAHTPINPQYTGGVALQTYSPTSDAVIITSLAQTPFCCHEDLLTMPRPQLVTIAGSINERLPKALQIDVSDIRDAGFIRNEIEVLVGLRAEVPNAPKIRKSFTNLKEGLDIDIDGIIDGVGTGAHSITNILGIDKENVLGETPTARTTRHTSLPPSLDFGRGTGRWGQDVIASLKDFDFDMEMDLSPSTSPLTKRILAKEQEMFVPVMSPTKLERLKEEWEEEERAERDEAAVAQALDASGGSRRELERPSCIPRIELDAVADTPPTLDNDESAERPPKKRRVSIQMLSPDKIPTPEDSPNTTSRTQEAGSTPFKRGAVRPRLNVRIAKENGVASQPMRNAANRLRALPDEYTPSPNRGKRVSLLKAQRTMFDMKERPVDPNDPFASSPAGSLTSSRGAKLQLLGPKDGLLKLAPKGLDTAFVTTTRPRYRFRSSQSEGLLDVMFGHDTSPSPLRPLRGNNLTPLTTPKSPGDMTKGKEEEGNDNSPVEPPHLKITRNAPRTPRSRIKKRSIPGFTDQEKQGQSLDVTPRKTKAPSRGAVKKRSQQPMVKSQSHVELKANRIRAGRKEAGEYGAGDDMSDAAPKIRASSSLVVMLSPSSERRFHSFSAMATEKDPDTKRLLSTRSGFGMERNRAELKGYERPAIRVDDIPPFLTVASSSTHSLMVPELLGPGFEFDGKLFAEKGRKKSVGETASLARGLVEMNMGE